MIVTPKNVDSIIEKLSQFKVFVLDIEASGLDVLNDDFVCGIGIGVPLHEAYYFPFRHVNDSENLSEKYIKRILDILEGSTIIGHNIKYDIKGLYKEGFDYSKCSLIDTMIMVRLCSKYRNPRFKLPQVTDDFLEPGRSSYKSNLKTYFRKNKIKRHCDAPINEIGLYCCNDVLCTFDLYVKLGKMIKQTKQTNIFALDCEMIKVLLNMEILGVKIDRDYCKKCMNLLDKKDEELTKDIYKLAGGEFNIDSHPQLGEVFKKLGIKSPLKTTNDDDSWSQPALVQLYDLPICKKLVNYRTINTLRRTFFGPMLEKKVDIINTSFKIWGTITGRLSCSEPNLQNVPKFIKSIDDEKEAAQLKNEDFERVKRIAKSGAGGRTMASGMFTGDESYIDEKDLISARRLFISRPGTSLFSIDLSQMEVVVFLYYIGETDLLKKIEAGEFDFHDFVAIEALGAKKGGPNFNFIREIAKSITFGIIYGMGLKTLSLQIGKSIEEAKEFRRKYFNAIPKAKKFINEMTSKIENGGAVYNVYGRRYFLDINESYKIINYLVQGTAGEIIKERMIEIDKFLADKKTKMLIQIHDELLIEVPFEEEHYLKNIADIITVNSLGIKMKVDIKKCSGNWACKEKYVLQKA